MKAPAGRIVFRYPLEMTHSQFVSMPPGTILHIDYQVRAPHQLCIWALVDPDADVVLEHIVITGTGHSVAEGCEHLATVQDLTGYVWHVWRGP